ncbi:6950_t:CDS:2 [Funneliformis geosporum]|uniref:6950_t:CDS:1 n=1 Tax=Funneliformis geosporum TaxID=1117311 RepID=A0A9W4STI0_9GLOM|nr:6950_t:CDS:2 [Funneliformis geosporum]
MAEVQLLVTIGVLGIVLASTYKKIPSCWDLTDVDDMYKQALMEGIFHDVHEAKVYARYMNFVYFFGAKVLGGGDSNLTSPALVLVPLLQ